MFLRQAPILISIFFMLFLEYPSSLILLTVSLTHWSVLLTTLPHFLGNYLTGKNM